MLSVLVVEDNVAVRAAIARALDRRGCSVTTATNGLEGLEAVRARSFDVVITDLNMPVMDGLQFLQERKRDPALASIPVLVISAASASQAQAMALGAADYLQKPIEELAAKATSWSI